MRSHEKSCPHRPDYSFPVRATSRFVISGRAVKSFVRQPSVKAIDCSPSVLSL